MTSVYYIHGRSTKTDVLSKKKKKKSGTSPGKKQIESLICSDNLVLREDSFPDSTANTFGSLSNYWYSFEVLWKTVALAVSVYAGHK